jgi:hypothetical protein
MLTQNAYQTIWKGHSLGPELAEEKAEAEKKQKEYERDHPEEAKKMREAAAQFEKDMKAKGAKDENEPGPAILIVVYFIFLVAAVIIGYVMPLGMLRVIIFASATGVAALILLIQSLVGFPIQTKFDEQVKKQGALFGNAGNQSNKDIPQPFCRQTIWLHLTWPILLGALGVIGAEQLLAGGAGKRGKKRRYEDDDEDEDDRPRKKRRARDEDDDDEDDRPRKKSRARDDDDDEDEDDRPRKKSRARDDDDDEDEDDRPRKKSRARDEDDEDDEDEGIRKRRR